MAGRGPRRLGLPRRRVLATTRAGRPRPRRRSSGLNAAKLYGVDGARGPAAPRRRRARRPTPPTRSWSKGLREPHARGSSRRWARSTTRSSTSRSPRSASSAPASWPTTATSRCACGCPTPQCAPNFAFLMAADARTAVRRLPEVARASRSSSRTTTPARRSTPRWCRGGRLRRRRSRARRPATWTRCASSSGARRCSRARGGVCQALLADGASARGDRARCASPTCPTSPDAVRGVALRAALGLPHDPDAPGARRRRRRAARASTTCRRGCAARGSSA